MHGIHVCMRLTGRHVCRTREVHTRLFVGVSVVLSSPQDVQRVKCVALRGASGLTSQRLRQRRREGEKV